MKVKIENIKILSGLILGVILVSGITHAGTLNPDEILTKVDDVINAPRDQEMTIKLVIVDKKGNERVRQIIMLQKGSTKRIGKFISPADQKGIGFLSLPGGMTYVYLPAYKKVRRIASQTKDNKFAGTDFTYEDMEAARYSEKWQAKLEKEEGTHYVLGLTPIDNNGSDYSRLAIWVQADNYYPTRIEYYDQAGTLIKVMTRKNIEKVDSYWVSKELEMQDLRTGNRSTMILEDVKFDKGLSDDMFTERYLSR
jgi:outer membrane lipoprotein-sorting protein